MQCQEYGFWWYWSMWNIVNSIILYSNDCIIFYIKDPRLLVPDALYLLFRRPYGYVPVINAIQMICHIFGRSHNYVTCNMFVSAALTIFTIPPPPGRNHNHHYHTLWNQAACVTFTMFHIPAGTITTSSADTIVMLCYTILDWGGLYYPYDSCYPGWMHTYILCDCWLSGGPLHIYHLTFSWPPS